MKKGWQNHPFSFGVVSLLVNDNQRLQSPILYSFYHNVKLTCRKGTRCLKQAPETPQLDRINNPAPLADNVQRLVRHFFNYLDILPTQA